MKADNITELKLYILMSLMFINYIKDKIYKIL